MIDRIATLGQGGGKTLTATDTTSPFSFSVNTVAPLITEALAHDTGASNSDGITSDATLVGSGDPNAVVTFTEGGVLLATTVADGTGAWTFTPSLPEGPHTIIASETDAAGNLASASLSFTLDTSAAQPANHLAHDTGVSQTDAVTSDATLTGLAAPNETLVFTEGASILGTTTADAAGIWTFVPPNLADGTHVIAAGDSQDFNLAVQGNGYFQIQLPSGEIAYTRDGSFSLSPTGQLVTADGNVVQPGITIPSGALAVTIDDTGTVRALLDGQPAPVQLGTIQLAIFANQAGLTPLGGNLFQTSPASGTPEVGSPGSSGIGSVMQFGMSNVSFTLDTQGPAIPTIQGLAPGSDSGIDGDGITNVAQPTVVGTADAGSTIVLSDGALQVGSAIADPVSGAWSIVASTLSDGEHLLTATSSDPAGNVSPASAPLDVTIDTIAPPVTEALALDTGASSSDGITSDATLVGSGDPNAVVTLTEGGSQFATTVADGTGAWTFTPSLPDGPHTIVASETDTAGNLASVSLDVTLLTPITENLATDTGIAGDLITADPTLTGSAKPNVLLTLTEGGQVLGTATADGSGIWSFRPVGLADGAHTIVVGNDLNVAIQGAGFFQIQLPDGEIAYTSDGAFVLSATGQLVTANGNAVLPGITIPNGALAVTIDDTGAVQVLLAGQPTPIQVGNIQIATFANEAGLVPLGGGLFQASANSGAPITGSPGSPGFGTISQAETASLSFTLDTSAAQPANHLAHDTGVSQTDAVTSDATLTGLAAPNETLVFTEGASILGTTTADAAGIWTFVPPNLADGTHVIAAGDSQDFNLAVQGNGYFQIQLPSGEIAYTRDGSFSLSATGQLVTADGNVVQPGITIPSGALAVTIDDTGTVRALLDGQPAPVQLGTIQLAIFANQAGLTPLGGNLFQASPASGTPEVGSPGSSGIGSVMQLGMSDVNFTLVTPITENLATDTGIAGDLITADPTLTGSAKPNVLLTLTEGGQVLGTATADGSGIWSFRPVGLADGAHTIVVGNDLNVAIQGAGFFQIQLPDGEIAYTSDGAFVLSATGQLVTANGNAVLPGITIPNGALAVTIDDTGAVQVLLAGQPTPIQVGNIQIATFANEAGLVPLGGGLFQASANSGAPITGSPGSPGFGTISQAETASLSFTLDTSAAQPANHLAHDTGVSQTDAVTSDATLTGLAAPNETLVFTEGASILGTTTADAAGIWTFVPPNLADGTHVIAAGDSQDFNLAVQGNGYFQIQLPSGEIAYTRDGSFSLSATGQLVTADGNVVQPGITIPSGALAVTIDDTGSVRALLDGQPAPVQLGTIQLAIFANQAGLTPLGGNLFQASPASGTPEVGSPGSSGIGSVMQLGMSDVNFTLVTPITENLATDTGIAGDLITADPTLTGSAKPNVLLTLTEGGQVLGTATADGSGIWSFRPVGLADGAHTIVVGNDLNVAIQGAGFFQIQLPDGEIAYTSDGAFVLSATGQLVTANGNAVLPGITIPNGALAVTIDDTGAVQVLLAGQPTPIQVGNIQIATFANEAGLVPLGGGLFQASANSGASITGSPGSPGFGTISQAETASLSFTLDTSAAQPANHLAHDTGVSQTDAVTSDATLTGLAAPNETLVFTEGASILGTTTADAAGIWTFVPPNLADGTHVIAAGDSQDFNLAVQGNGYFQIQLPSGEIAYTRDGSFSLSPTGQLVTADGNVVQPGITIPSGALAVTIDDTGTVRALLDGQPAPVQLGTIQLAIFANQAGLTPLGGNLFQASPASGTPEVGSPGSSGIGSVMQLGMSNVSFTLDTQGPAIPTIQGLAPGSDSGIDGDGITNVVQPTVVGTADAGSIVVLSDGAVQVGSAIADPVSGAWSIVASTLSDGEHLLTVTSSDPAGNVSPASAPLDVTIDTIAPPVIEALALDTGASSSDGITSDATLVGSGDPNAVVTLTEGGSQFATTVADGTGAWTFTPSLPDGPHTITASETDTAGNLASASLDVTLLTQGPAIPTIQGLAPGSDSGIDGDGITNVAQPTVVGTADAGSIVVLSDGAVQVGSAIADPVSGAWSIVASTLSDGEHLLTVTSSDPAGNVSLASAPLDVTIDTIAPPVIEALALDTGASSSDCITFDATLVGSGDPNAVVTLTEGGSQFATTVADGTGAWTITPSLPDGPHTITASETDTAGNLASASLDVTLLTQGPAIPTIQGLAPGSDSGIDGDGITNVAQPTVVGTADAGSTIVLFADAVQVGSAIADPVSGAWSIVANTLSDGEHLLTVTSSDPAGNVSPASAPLDVTIDTIAPPVIEALALDTGASSSDGITSDATLVGSGDPNAVVTLTEGGSQFATTVADGTGAWTFTPSLPDGPHTIVASETDTAGNLASASLDVTLLTQGPAIPTIQGLAPGSDSGIDGDGITNVAQPTVVGTADAGSTIVLFADAVQVGSAIADPVSGAWSIVASTLSDGEHLLTVTSSDPAGNVSLASAPLDVTIDTIAPPVIEALALDTGASSSDGITSDATLVGSGDPNAVVTLTEGGSQFATTVADGTGAWTFTPSLPEGPHTIVASETDAAGNLASASLDFTLVAQTFWKDSLAGGLWETSGNWTNNVPTAGTDAFLDLSTTATITATATDNVARSLEISNQTPGAISDLLVSNTLTVGKSVTVNGGGELHVAVGGLFNQINSAGIAIQSGATLSVEGILQAGGGLSVVGSSKAALVPVSIGSGGTLDVGRTGGDSSLSFATVTLDGGTLLQGQGHLFIDAATTITSTGASVIGESSVFTSGVAINNSGLIISLGGTLLIDPPSPGASQGINSSGGTVSANGGAIDVVTNVTDASTGAFDILNGGQLEFDGNFNASGESIDFLPGADPLTRSGALIINNAAHGLGTIGSSFSGPLIMDFSPSSTNSEAIDFRNLTYNASDTIAINSIDGTNVLQIMDGLTSVAYVGLGSGSITDPSSLSLVADAFGGTEIIPCFLSGTRILTVRGGVAVEDLTTADMVVTLSGNEHVARPVTWIGRRRIDLTAHPRPETVAPVRIQCGAFADNMPHRDLLVSPDHAIFIDGKLICARQLINGSTIRQEKGWRSMEYFHVELDEHAILVAEGLPAESYLNTGNRGFFANSDVPLVLHPDLTDQSDYPARVAASCVPFVSDEGSVRPIWLRLAERAAALGQPAPKLETTNDPDLRIVANGRMLRPIVGEAGKFTFVLPRGTADVRLVSRAGSPTDARPWLDDRRQLGVRVTRIVLRGASEFYDMPVDHPDLSEGWWSVERDGVSMGRWTDGEAVLPLPAFNGAAMLEVRLGGEMTYLIEAGAKIESGAEREAA